METYKNPATKHLTEKNSDEALSMLLQAPTLCCTLFKLANRDESRRNHGSFVFSLTHTHTHTHIHTHKHTHRNTHTLCNLLFKCTQRCMHAHAQSHTYMCAHLLAHMLTHTPAYILRLLPIVWPAIPCNLSSHLSSSGQLSHLHTHAHRVLPIL